MTSHSARAAIARVFWRLSPWRLARETEPVAGPRILVGAPHTSNFDFLLMLAIAWDAGMRIHWLGKRELFRGMAGPVMRALGGIPVDRANASGVVDEVVARARRTEGFLLVVTPEGTRRGAGWRSGFYRIAWSAGLPVTLGFADGSTRTAGLGPTLALTGDVGADMDRIRAFYRDKSGVRPQYRTEPRLHDEAGLTRQLAEGREGRKRD
ncbi:1-acyl-sn-glycerol-3-phosphate acyltransferase [Leucobacter triazinivorans]|uniref:Acyl-phosphate glycerol 3-phosphate acyltransferase n=1 Tax=Leucobacter triazinivorans TaxID=1784719 RepID=A0A4P6KDT8_9MICO|nr:1-acyl-sn-glycerol-3-phosphate acyltransferase [Leucobacter triazinivorans]QBE48402.1 acyl-phosphate glycerol 3-phosphate acyltransferase [Leucobacter triazinivorans]